MIPTINIENLGFDQGAHVLIKYYLQKISVGEEISVTGTAPEWQSQISAWSRSQGHAIRFINDQKNIAYVKRGSSDVDRWNGALLTGLSDPKMSNAVLDQALPEWGLASRGALVEAGSTKFQFRLNKKIDIWCDNAADLYSQAVNAQWNPNDAIDWSKSKNHSDILEDALVQVLTFMVENENAALLVPARFLGQLHPHFREVQALLAIQIADEARHIEVFTRRIRLYGRAPATSTADGQASLKTLLDQHDFSIAGFLLSVLGEGTFVDLLQFLHQFAPDSASREIAMLAARDESRHVGFGMSHLIYHLEKDPDLRYKLAQAIKDRHDGLATTSGLNAHVFDSLILLAAKELTPTAIANGFLSVQKLLREMSDGRKARLIRLGFSVDEAESLSNMHTRNFM